MAAPKQSKPDLSAEIERYRKSLDENPGSRLFAALADAMRRSGDVDGAISVAEEGLRRHPRYLGGMVVLGQAYADNQQYDRAKELFLQVVRMNPENIVAQRALAGIYEELNESFNAMRTYAILNILDPSDKNVRARLQELEEARAGAGRPSTAAKPFSSPPTAPSKVKPEEPPVTAPEDTKNESAELDAPQEASEPISEIPPDSNEDSTQLPPEPTSKPEPEPEPEPESPGTQLEVVPGPPVVPPEVEKRLAGLNQFFDNADAPETDRPGKSIASAPTAPISDPSGDLDEDTMVLPASPVPEPPPPPPEPILSFEEKLDLFFGGANLDLVGIAAKAGEFVAMPAQDAFKDTGSETPPPLADGNEIKIFHSKLGAIFWSQGFYEKAVSVIAGEIKSRPGDALLRAEFNLVARAIGIDPDEKLESLRAELSALSDAVESEGDDSTTDTDPVQPDASQAAEDTSSPAPNPGGDSESEPDQTGDPRINILRSYLNRIRKDKESIK